MSDSTLFNPHFSHIYIEREAYQYLDTHQILAKFPEATRISIDNYKEVFDRANQEWRTQKRSQSIILAVRHDAFLYDGSDIAPDFGNRRFFYNTLALNCLYDCDYCYLQGMFPSAHTVLFVNNVDFQQAVETELGNGPMYLAISYDTDLLAFEQLLPYCRRWIRFTAQKQHLTVELRTKSANFRAISNITPPENVVLAWTLSPAEIADKFEPKTPGFQARLRAVKKAVEKGWPVRLCFDPLLYVKNWRTMYGSMLDDLNREVDLNLIRDISIGVFRMPAGFLREIRNQRQDSEILYYPYETRSGVASYPKDIKQRMEEFVFNKLTDFVQPEKIDVL